MVAIRAITAFLNIGFIFLIWFFCQEMTWDRDKVSMVGFSLMAVLFAMNTVLIWF